MLDVLSFGAGVQSTALLFMSCRELLPKLDVAVFSDTGWEPREVYEHLEWCKGYAAGYGIPVVTVTAGNIREQYMDYLHNGKRFASIPLHILQSDGSRGMNRRQCTREFKITPIENYLRREVLGLKYRQRAPQTVQMHQWMGISYDEMQRATSSRVLWKDHRFPFLHDLIHGPMLDKPWRRHQIREWLEAEYPNIHVPRSACIGCPYHSDAEWRRIKEDPEAWADAVEFDEAIRNQPKMEGRSYLHRSCEPLKDVDLRTDVDHGQGLLSWADECDGMCGM
jgi:3'-phosphoadenosine 5'-phosphosulfate sulfotransferase (PAPS reductase)/FAD synthetase